MDETRRNFHDEPMDANLRQSEREQEAAADRRGTAFLALKQKLAAPSVEPETAPTTVTPCDECGGFAFPNGDQRHATWCSRAPAPTSRGEAQPTPDTSQWTVVESISGTIRIMDDSDDSPVALFQQGREEARRNAEYVMACILASQSSPRAHAATPESDNG